MIPIDNARCAAMADSNAEKRALMYKTTIHHTEQNNAPEEVRFLLFSSL